METTTLNVALRRPPATLRVFDDFRRWRRGISFCLLLALLTQLLAPLPAAATPAVPGHPSHPQFQPTGDALMLDTGAHPRLEAALEPRVYSNDGELLAAGEIYSHTIPAVSYYGQWDSSGLEFAKPVAGVAYDLCAEFTATGVYTLSKGKTGNWGKATLQTSQERASVYTATYACEGAFTTADNSVNTPFSVVGESAGAALNVSLCTNCSHIAYTCVVTTQAHFSFKSGAKATARVYGSRPAGSKHNGLAYAVSWQPCAAPLPTERTLGEGTGAACLDSAGQGQKPVLDPINTYSGNFTRQEVDATWAAPGRPFSFARTYNSLSTASSPLGPGWTHSYALRLVDEPTQVVLRTAQGAALPFAKAGGAFTPAAGVRATLTLANDVYRLTEGDGTLYTFDSNGRLLAIADTQGNTTSLVYSGNDLWRIVTPNGLAATLSYDGAGRLTRLETPLQPPVFYTYTDGRLTQVTDVHGETWQYGYDDAGRMTTFTDPRGATVTNTYDARGRVSAQTNALGQTATLTYGNGQTTVTDAAGRSTVYTYDRTGLLTAERDPLGHVTTYTRDDNYNLTAVTDPLGRTTRFTWDAPGCRYTQVTDALSQTTHFTYNPAHYLTAITDPLSRTTAMAYDPVGNLIQLTNALGYTATFTYTPEGQLRTSTDARGATTTYGYDLGGNLATVTDALGYTTFITHDVLGRPLTVTDALGHSSAFAYAAADRLVRSVDARGGVTTYTYDAVGQVVSVTDPRGATTTFTYDAAGYLTAATDALSHTTTYTYDAADAQTQRRLTAITDANGHTTALTYDAAGRLTMSTDAAQHPTWYAYDAVGNLTAVTDALQRTTRFQYDALNRTVAVTDTLGHGTWYGYNAVGQVVAVLRPDGRLVQYTYDALDRPQSVSVPGVGTVYQYAYDPVGNLTQVTNAANVSTHYTYDELRRMTQAVNPAQQATTYAYDALGNLATVTDANQHHTQYLYDELHRLTGVLEPEGGQTTYGYNANGQVNQVTDARGHTTLYRYDLAERPIRVIQSPAEGVVYTTTLTYDAVGNPLARETADGLRTTITYDARNAPTQVIYPAVGPTPGYTVTYGYDAVGNRQMLSDTTGITQYTYDAGDRLTQVTPCEDSSGYGGGLWLCLANSERIVRYTYDTVGRRTHTWTGFHPVTYTYDMADRLATVTDWAGGVTAYTYQADGAVAGVTRPNGVQSAYGYTAAGQVLTLTHTRPDGAPLAAYTYIYDPAGNRTVVVETVGQSDPCYCPPGDECPHVECGAFDDVTTTTTQYTYDAQNRLLTAQTGADGWHYAYDAVGNRTAMTTTHNSQPTTTYTYDNANRLTNVQKPTASHPYTWDARGNLLSDGVFTYRYDGANRMVGATSLTTTAVYTYNGDGLLLAQAVNGVKTTFIWDQALDLPQLLAEFTGSGLTTDARYHLYGLERIGVQQDGAWSYPLSDALGSVRKWTDDEGWGADPLYYDPFGVPLPRPNAPASPFGYTGEWTSAATGLQYLRARWYDPATGRFTQVDPFPGVLSRPGTLNPYPYALNNPLRYTDPSGEFVGVAAIVASGLIGAAFAAGGYVFSHPGQGLECYLRDGDFWRAVGMGAASGLISGFLMGYFAPLSLLATGFGSAMQIGAFLGMTSGGMTYIATSLLFGEPITTQGIVAAMMGGAVFGAIGGALGYWAQQARPQPAIPQEQPARLVYRNPGEGQHPEALSKGFRPKAPDNMTRGPAFHIARGSQYGTRFISLTRSLEIARKWQKPNIPIYVIDLQKVHGNVIDFTDDIVRNQLLLHPRANNMALGAAEVLVEGWIPPEAILELLP